MGSVLHVPAWCGFSRAGHQSTSFRWKRPLRWWRLDMHSNVQWVTGTSLQCSRAQHRWSSVTFTRLCSLWNRCWDRLLSLQWEHQRSTAVKKLMRQFWCCLHGVKSLLQNPCWALMLHNGGTVLGGWMQALWSSVSGSSSVEHVVLHQWPLLCLPACCCRQDRKVAQVKCCKHSLLMALQFPGWRAALWGLS